MVEDTVRWIRLGEAAAEMARLSLTEKEKPDATLRQTLLEARHDNNENSEHLETRFCTAEHVQSMYGCATDHWTRFISQPSRTPLNVHSQRDKQPVSGYQSGSFPLSHSFCNSKRSTCSRRGQGSSLLSEAKDGFNCDGQILFLIHVQNSMIFPAVQLVSRP